MKAKKSLGQNFLKDSKTLNTITEAVLPNVPVLEIGPGKGALTRKLLDAGHVVTAIEKDDRLIEPLQEMFSDEIAKGQFCLVHGDALEDGPEQVLGTSVSRYQVVANLPYYITGLYLRRTLESSARPEQLVLLLQKEVVDRIVAKDSKESILSISVKAFGQVKKLCNVDRKYFSPAPKIDSAVLQVSEISDNLFNEYHVDMSSFFSVLRAGFASKRKILANNLKPLLRERDVSFDQVMQTISCQEKDRPENLTVKQWFCLAQLLITD